MMMYWVETVDAEGKVISTSGYYTSRKHAEAKRAEMQEHAVLQSHLAAHVFIRHEMSEPERERSK